MKPTGNSRNRLWSKAAAAGLAAALASASTAALAAKDIKLTVLSGYAPNAAWVRVFKEYWMPEVNRRLAEKGAYNIVYTEVFGTVVKPRGELDGVQQGLGDIGLVVTAFHADKFPLESISFVTPFVSTDAALNARTYDALAAKFPKWRDNWDRYNMVLLGYMGSVPNYAVLSRAPIKTIDDLKGKKIAGAGLNLRWVEGIGATGVPSALTKFYSDTKSGVSDGMLAWGDAVGAFKLCEAGPYFLKLSMGAVTSFAVAANKRTWNGLPDEVRTVMKDVTARYRDELARQATAGDSKGLDACKAQGGTIVEMSDGERQRWAAALPNIAKEWADDADKRGFPGNEALKAYMDIMRDNKQPIARHWDRK